MEYLEAKYSLLMFFSNKSLYEAGEAFNVLEPLINGVSEKDYKMNVKGFAYKNGLRIETIRKAKWKGFDSFRDRDYSKGGTKALNLYIYDSEWSMLNAPTFLTNCYLTVNDFEGKVLTYQGQAVKSFFSVAYNESNFFENDCEKVFLGIFDAIGCFGYIFKNIGYAYDGKTYIEWAYKNVPIKIETSISEWNEVGYSAKLFKPIAS